jgi:hypothetical protein
MFIEMPVGGVGSQPSFHPDIFLGGGLVQQMFYQQLFMDAGMAPGFGM